MENKDLGPKKGETAEQFKSRIEETQRELKRMESQGTKPETPTPAAPAPVATVEAPAQVSPTVPPVINPDPAGPPKGVVTGNQEVDKWLEKKGFKSTEDMAQSLRELERELHRRTQEGKPVAPAPGGTNVPTAPVYPPYYPPAPVQPAPNYGYPPPPPAPYPPQYAPPPVDVEKLASRYGMTVEDFEKVSALANDMAESKVDRMLRSAITPIQQRVLRVDNEVSRQKEMVDLMSDPLFKNPQVQFEMHRVLEADPTIVERYPQPHRYAFNEALMRVARNNLGGSNAAPKAPEAQPVAPPSTKPPTTAGGNGGGGGGAPSGPVPEQVTPEMFARMTMEQKREHLKLVGAR